MAHTPPKFVMIEGQIINRDEVAWVSPQMKWDEDLKKDVVIGSRIEFIRRGYITVQRITPAGVFAMLNGDPF